MKQTIRIVAANTVKQRNPMAAQLSDPRWRRRVVENRKAYNRKLHNRNHLLREE